MSSTYSSSRSLISPDECSRPLNVQSRTSRRFSHSIRSTPSMNSVHDLKPSMRLEARDVSTCSSRNLDSRSGITSRDDSIYSETFHGRVWSRDDSFLHYNSRSNSPMKGVPNDDQTVRIANSIHKRAAVSRKLFDAKERDYEPMGIPAMKCGPKVISKLSSKRIQAVSQTEPKDTNRRNDSEMDLGVECEIKKSTFAMRKTKSRIQSGPASQRDSVRPISRGRTRLSRSDSVGRSRSTNRPDKDSSIDEKSAVDMQALKTLIKRSLSIGRKADPEMDDTHHPKMTPSQMKSLTMKIASFRRSKSYSKSNTVDPADTSPRTVMDLPEIPQNMPKESASYTPYDDGTRNRATCEMGSFLFNFGCFGGDYHPEANEHFHETGSAFSETHV